MSIVVGFAGGYFVGGILYKVMYGLFGPEVVKYAYSVSNMHIFLLTYIIYICMSVDYNPTSQILAGEVKKLRPIGLTLIEALLELCGFCCLRFKYLDI